MEGFRFWKIGLYLSVFLLVCCAKTGQPLSVTMDGHWYGSYGESPKSYGEAIYANGKACFYSDDFGLQYREYKIERDSILKIYDDGILDQERILKFLDANTMNQYTIVGHPNNEIKLLSFFRVIDSDIDESKIFSNDTTEQNKFVMGFMLRREQWEMNGKR